jgi:hypothetical protein
MNGKRDGSRCCAGKRKVGRLRPLRPLGGSTWAAAAARLHNGSRLLMSGDSVEQQLFVALLCSAWAEPGFTVQPVEAENVEGCARGRVEQMATRWHAELAWCLWIFDLRKNHLQGRAARVNVRGLPPPEKSRGVWGGTLRGANATALLHGADALIVGGWHHGVPRGSTVAKLLQLLARTYPRRWLGVIDATSVHFPGGMHKGDHIYPPATPDEHAACDHDYTPAKLSRPFRGHPTLTNLGNAHFEAFNVELARAVNSTNTALLATAVTPRRHSVVRLISAAELYRSRGDAHTDDTGLPKHASLLHEHSWKSQSSVPRDCLHFCHSPGVLDALALATLSQLILR